ncbi:hypothetical protein DBR47_18910 [Paucibacter sp. KBW04]|uniref:nucleotidyltransferase domain-containing protein n=1 Tax=Paucibacter sp. KBW04 TaxID=2153361 RepID=UPI000F55C1DA|nr:nucleotidyltransferase family protein [Paucibacter sp. KBW04]RQO55939.1 hypothetical protein DBR47_18910 [Paucibacter sp. KBW04]
MSASSGISLLSRALVDPAACLLWDVRDWETLLQQARRANLLARLALGFERAGLLSQVPAGPRRHFDSVQKVVDSQERAVRWEVGQIAHALHDLGAPVLLLKGAAYVMAGLPAAQNRLFADVDILVPRPQLEAVEYALQAEGWQNVHHDAYDQRYYREWMHEIPPMRHQRRDTVIDVHHNILPLTSRLAVDAKLLLAQAVPIAGWPGLYRLDDVDLVLHSACHLFLDGEFDKGLRDLVDLDALLRHFGGQLNFWGDLQARARALGLGRVLFYALRYSAKILQTPVPREALRSLRDVAPDTATLAWMDGLFLRALQPDHPSSEDAWTGAARRLLYLRAHWMRMPLGLLIRHLATKALRREPEDAAPV